MKFDNIERLLSLFSELLASSDGDAPETISCFMTYPGAKYISVVYSSIDGEIKVNIPENSEEVVLKVVKALNNLNIKTEVTNGTESWVKVFRLVWREI